jgi:hypothetical protein
MPSVVISLNRSNNHSIYLMTMINFILRCILYIYSKNNIITLRLITNNLLSDIFTSDSPISPALMMYNVILYLKCKLVIILVENVLISCEYIGLLFDTSLHLLVCLLNITYTIVIGYKRENYFYIR